MDGGGSDLSGWYCLFITFALPAIIVIIVMTMIYIGARAGGKLLASKDREIQRRFHEGRCLNCGYDLRVSTNGRCPECGKF